jgi:hypothetical protein
MRKSLRRGVVLGLLATLVTGAAVVLAVEKEKTPPTEPLKRATTENEHVTYLGVAVEPLYRPMASHLPELFGDDQGVLVTTVVPQSPAEKAGIKPDDVLMTYGDQKLFSPEQLAKLVKSDKVGSEVTLSLIREGNVEQLTATLGEHEVGSQTSATPSKSGHEWWGWQLPEWHMPYWHMPQWFTRPRSPSTKDAQWQSFDSMTIKKLGDNQFKAEVQYLDKDGKMQHQEFKGTREEVHNAIVAQKDLPENEREHLLRSLDMPSGELVIPSLHVDPGHGFTWHFDTPDQSL